MQFQFLLVQRYLDLVNVFLFGNRFQIQSGLCFLIACTCLLAYRLQLYTCWYLLILVPNHGGLQFLLVSTCMLAKVKVVCGFKHFLLFNHCSLQFLLVITCLLVTKTSTYNKKNVVCSFYLSIGTCICVNQFLCGNSFKVKLVYNLCLIVLIYWPNKTVLFVVYFLVVPSFLSKIFN